MDITKEKLEELYNKKKLSYSQIAKKLSTNNSRIQFHMKKFGIKARSYSESKRLEIGRGIPNFKKIKKENWKAFAWLLDGEGSIGFQSYKVLTPAISIGVSSKKLIDNLEKEFPELFCRCVVRKMKWKGYEWVMHSLRVNSSEYIVQILKRTIPYLSTKKNIAILLKKFCENRQKWRKSNFNDKERKKDIELAGFIKRMNMKKQTDEQKDKIFEEAKIFVKKNKIKL